VGDEPGTTRDHVGALIDLAGLVVRFVDAPGVSAAPAGTPDARALGLAESAARTADLLLLCADPTSDFLSPPAGAPRADSAGVVRVCLRADLGPAPPGSEVRVSLQPIAPGGPPAPGARPGLDSLVTLVRDALVSPAARASSLPWKFW
ncbi:MAG TPA: GTPase domain-containing protein, partial [Phycisphaerales bacterium]|nr:GTPase domain-containing protein [Phycisphaerales bacterium]